MNPELEALIKALDAYLEAYGTEAQRLRLSPGLKMLFLNVWDFPNLPIIRVHPRPSAVQLLVSEM
jgi:hypothetical protein